jgi:hypothetical protein
MKFLRPIPLSSGGLQHMEVPGHYEIFDKVSEFQNKVLWKTFGTKRDELNVA